MIGTLDEIVPMLISLAICFYNDCIIIIMFACIPPYHGPTGKLKALNTHTKNYSTV